MSFSYVVKLFIHPRAGWMAIHGRRYSVAGVLFGHTLLFALIPAVAGYIGTTQVGWLPCGLVYAALALALVSGGATAGALTMLAFGLGTLPALISLGFAGRWLAGLRHAGAALCVLGVVFLVGAYSGQLPGHHHGSPHDNVAADYVD